MNKPVRVTITGAAGQIGYQLAFRIASGQMLGVNQPIILQLLERSENMNCYKIILSCSENLKNYYYKLGFNECGILMKKN